MKIKLENTKKAEAAKYEREKELNEINDKIKEA